MHTKSFHGNMASEPFSPQELRDLHFVFSAFDPGGRGWVGASELRKALRVLGFKVSRLHMQELLRECAVGKGEAEEVTVETFVQVVLRLQGSAYDVHGELEQAFRLLDRDGDGLLSQEDLRNASRDVSLRLSSQELQGLVEAADRDGDGMVSLEEFTRTMLKTNLFK